MFVSPRKAIQEHLTPLLKKEKSKVVVLHALENDEFFQELNGKYPEQVLEFVHHENEMFAHAAGLAKTGVTPYVFAKAISCTHALKSLRQFVCLDEMNVKIFGVGSGVSIGEEGALMHGMDDISIMRNLPNMQVFSPADFMQAQSMMEVLQKSKKPMYIRLHAQGTNNFNNEKYQFEVGKVDHLVEGDDVVIFATGGVLVETMKAAEILREQTDYSASVMNVSTIKPFDSKGVIDMVKKAKLIVTVEDHSIVGGLGSLIAETLAEHTLGPLLRLGLQNQYYISGTVDDLYEVANIDANGIFLDIKKQLKNV